jgi:putative hemolysin
LKTDKKADKEPIELFIDLDKNIQESNSAFLKKLPGFVKRTLKRIVRQDELNTILTKYKNDIGLDFLNSMIADFELNLVISGKENLPENGRCFFAANHPFGILDGLILTHTVASKYGSLTAIANDAFMLIPQLRPFITEVNVYGSSSKERIRTLNAMYASELPITHFPAGEVSRVYHNKIQDAPWQKSFIKKSIEYQRDIVPIHFEGGNSSLFYRIFKIRRALGLGMNIELMLLPREFFRMRNRTIRVHIGKPISYKTFTTDRTHDEWAQAVRAEVYNLAKV